MAYCPNKNDKDFKKMVEHLGEDLAYHVWDKNGGNSVEYAPNGEKSIMFESLKNELGEKKAYEVAAKTHSKAFKEWFGNSKVVDKNGQPLVVYHGTGEDIDEISKEFGNGFWTGDKRAAKEFGDVIPAFLKIEKTKIIDFKGGDYNSYPVGFRNEDGDFYEYDPYYEDISFDEYLNKYLEERDLKPSDVEVQYGGDEGFSNGSADILVRSAQLSKKYDGAIFKDVSFTGNNYIAFDPTQIKSISNQGTFDKKNADIRFDVIEKTPELTEEQKIKNKELTKDAIKLFGLATNFKESGYLTTDGKLLDFSGRHEADRADRPMFNGKRYVDHRQIQDIDGTDMLNYMSYGNIRMTAESDGFEMTRKPTPEQFSMLKKYIRTMNHGALVDFSKPNGFATEFSKEYPKNTNPDRIIADIKRYYDEGIKPVDSGMRFDVIDKLSSSFDKEKDVDKRHEAAVKLIDETKKALSLTTETHVVKNHKDLIKILEGEGKNSLIDGIKDIIEGNGGVRGLYYDDKIYLVSSNMSDSKQLLKSFLHEQTHLGNDNNFEKEHQDFYDKNKKLVESLIPEYYYDLKGSTQADEAVARTIEKLIDNHSLEEIYNGKADLSSIPEPIKELVIKSLNKLTKEKMVDVDLFLDSPEGKTMKLFGVPTPEKQVEIWVKLQQKKMKELKVDFLSNNQSFN